MPKLHNALFVLALSLFCLAATGVSVHAAKKVTFATDPEKAGGFLLELTIEAFKKVGYETQVEFVPWPRAVELANHGRVDALLGCYYSDERAQRLAYSHVLAESPLVLFAMESSKITYSKLEDLSTYKIGTIISAAYPVEFAEASYLKKEAVADYILNIRKLMAGRIDLFVEKKFVVTSFLKGTPQTAGDRLVALDPPLAVSKYYNAFSRATPHAVEKLNDFNRGLQLLKDEGLYEVIMKKSLHE